MIRSKVVDKRLARRDFIQDVAKKCFEDKGLHGVSISYIATQAELSVGQIYRIFESKEEIIEAVVNQIALIKVEKIVSQKHDLHKKALVLSGVTPQDEELRKGEILMMEISAEATRNVRINEILLSADKRMKEEGRRLLTEKYPHLAGEKIDALAEFIAILSEGAAYRNKLNESLELKLQMDKLYRDIFDHIFMS